MNSMQKSWHSQSSEDVLKTLGSGANGLSAEDAALRFVANGPNEIVAAKKISPVKLLLAQLNSILVWILIVAGGVSGFLGERIDAIAIFTIVILNAIVGFYQEYNAEKSIEALKAMTSPQAKVRRNGTVIGIPAKAVVPGDILILETGDLICADARLIASASLKCIESALTGESVAVLKNEKTLPQGEFALGDRTNIVYMGTSVAAGSAQAVVVATAMNTELGSIAGMIQNAGESRTPLQNKLDSLGGVLVWAALGIVGVLFLLGLLRGANLLELFLSSVSLAVAAVPEGLPAVVTVALALGVVRMSKQRTLVRKLSAVETLGSTSLICSDKTGTLTLGEMMVRSLYVGNHRYEVSGEGYSPKGEVLFETHKPNDQQIIDLRVFNLILLGCNNAHLQEENGKWSILGDPTEGAMLVAGIKSGGSQEEMENSHPKVHEFPFDSDRKRSTVIRSMPNEKHRVLTNGAPGMLLDRCSQIYCPDGIRSLTNEDRTTILEENTAMAQQALRVLGSAYRDLEHGQVDEQNPDMVEQDMVFVGLSGMYDPPRTEAKEAVATCQQAGIRVVMITGDNLLTAHSIARGLGIAADNAKGVTGLDLDKFSDEELRSQVRDITIYARVTAAHKLRIILACKANGEVVAMTGDGVNDAPAVKEADIGIAMGKSGTEVTKQAADMIITDDNFATIVAAVQEGRGIYDNIRKTLQYLLAGNSGELLLMTVCVVIGLPIPLLPIHLLWINILTDGLPALCLATDAIDPEVMKRKPRALSERITNRRFFITMAGTGLLTGGVSFAVYFYMLQKGTTQVAQTYAFAVLVFAELLRSFGARSETKPVWQIPLFTNINLVLVVVGSIGLQILSQHHEFLGRFLKTSSMSFTDGLILLGLGSIPLIVLEIVKLIKLRM